MIHIVLYHPEIPQNTGNIMRTTVVTGSFLHIIGPVPFYLDERHLRRAGLDYIDELQWRYYADYEQFAKEHNDKAIYYITRYGQKTYSDVEYPKSEEDVWIMFGRESTGIDHEILRDHLPFCLRIPMLPHARSLNLSNTVAIVVYEILRQHDFPTLAKEEILKGRDFLENEVNKNEE